MSLLLLLKGTSTANKSASDTGSVAAADTSAITVGLTASDTGSVAAADSSATTVQNPSGTNYAVNPQFATNTSKWAESINGMTRLTGQTTPIGTTAGRSSIFGANGTMTIIYTDSAPLVRPRSNVVTASVWVRSSAAAGNVQINLYSTGNTLVTSGSSSALTTGWQRIYVTGTYSSVELGFQADIVAGGTGTTNGQTVDVTGLMFQFSSTMNDYFEGTIADDITSVAISESVATQVGVTASDTGSVAAADVSSTIAATTTASDTGGLSIADTATIDVSFTTTDTGSVAAADNGTVQAQLTASDTGSVAAADASTVDIVTFVSASDTGSVAAADSSAVQAGATASDTGSVAAADASSLSLVGVPTSDTGSVAISESVTTTASVTASDTGSVAAADTSAITTSVTASDTGGMSIADSSSIAITALVTASDTGSVAAADVSTVDQVVGGTPAVFGTFSGENSGSGHDVAAGDNGGSVLPSSIPAGSKGIAIVTVNSSTGNPITAASGWTEIAVNNSSTTSTAYVYTKDLGPSDSGTAPNWNLPGTAARLAMSGLVLTNVASFETPTEGTVTGGATLTFPGWTPTAADTLSISMLGFRWGSSLPTGSAFSQSTGWTEQIENYTDNGSSTANVGTQIQTKQLTGQAGSAQGTFTTTVSPNGNNGVAFVVPAVPMLAYVKTGTDTSSVAAGDSAATQTQAGTNVTESAAITITESTTTLVSVTASDTGSVAAADTAVVAGFASVTDTGSVAISESIVIDVFLSRDDTSSVAVDDESVAGDITGDVPITGADTGSVASSETSSVDVGLDTTDTGGMAISESVTTKATLARTDTGSVAISESVATKSILDDADDTGSIAISDSSSIVISGTVTKSASDTGAVAIADASSSTLTIPTSDSGGMSISDSGAITLVTEVGSDESLVGIGETTHLFVSLSTTDTAGILINDTGYTFWDINADDTGAIGLTDFVDVVVYSTEVKSAFDEGGIALDDTATVFAGINAEDEGQVSIDDVPAIDVSGLVFKASPDELTLAVLEDPDILKTTIETIVRSAYDQGTLGVNESTGDIQFPFGRVWFYDGSEWKSVPFQLIYAEKVVDNPDVYVYNGTIWQL